MRRVYVTGYRVDGEIVNGFLGSNFERIFQKFVELRLCNLPASMLIVQGEKAEQVTLGFNGEGKPQPHVKGLRSFGQIISTLQPPELAGLLF